ncbi:MAG TPA: hypothetical protein PLG17_03335 [Thermodesulfobacteriota bacterium]|nr:hypothetical protein [Thermodesulfobacteriota bacterium]HQO77523.1 hypothetical protein [Thermodesulfobacteriota bacterium]
MAFSLATIGPRACPCLIVAIVIALCSASFGLHRRIDALTVTAKAGEEYRIIPSPDIMKPLTLGYDLLIADYLWIQTISYFADHLRTDQQYPLLYRYIDLVTTLDPKFKWAYYFGGIILSIEAKQHNESNTILIKAMREYPDCWQFPFYLGFNYWYFHNDSLRAASYLEQAAKLPNAPAYLQTFPATLYSEADDIEAALKFLQEIKQSLPDSVVEAGIEKRIQAITDGKIRRSSRKEIKLPAVSGSIGVDTSRNNANTNVP